MWHDGDSMCRSVFDCEERHLTLIGSAWWGRRAKPQTTSVMGCLQPPPAPAPAAPRALPPRASGKQKSRPWRRERRLALEQPRLTGSHLGGGGLTARAGRWVVRGYESSFDTREVRGRWGEIAACTLCLSLAKRSCASSSASRAAAPSALAQRACSPAGFGPAR